MAARTGTLLLASALISSCGPKSLTLPEEPIDRAATCGVVAAAEGRAATSDIKAPLPFDAMGRVLHYTLLAGSTGESFSPDAATAVQKRMTELQDRITEGKWQDLIPACRSAFPATAVTEVKLPDDRFDAQLGCYELGEYVSSALGDEAAYDAALSKFKPLKNKLDATIGSGLQSRVGGDFEAQQEERRRVLATIAKVGPPSAVLRQCLDRFG